MVGDMNISLFDDECHWHTYLIQDVWPMPGCDRVLYSQESMARLGFIHRLDVEGYIILPGGKRKSIVQPSYALEISLNTHPENSHGSNAQSASSLTIPLPSSITRADRGADTRTSVPQQLLWQRLGFPST